MSLALLAKNGNDARASTSTSGGDHGHSHTKMEKVAEKRASRLGDSRTSTPAIQFTNATRFVLWSLLLWGASNAKSEAAP